MRYVISIAAAICFFSLTGNVAFAQQDSAQARLFETLGDIKAFSKRMDDADDDVSRTDAMADLCGLYLRVVGDPRFSRSEVLQGYRGRIASRLQKSRKLIEKSKRKTRQATKQASFSQPVESAEDKEHRTIDSAIIDKQWLLIAHAVGGTAPSMYYSSGMHGTSGHFYRGRAGGLPGDNGDQLLNLLQTIIHPDFWQINGGPGRAYYYQPLRILVVRATQRVHEDMQNLLERLRGQQF